jgi:cobalt-zinc-cadmium resistance protein CzcA
MVIPFLLLFGSLQAQQQVNTLDINMETAIQMATDNNYELENARLDLEIANKLKKTTIELPPPEINLDLGQINSDLQDRYLSVSQSFRFPTSFGATGKLNKARVKMETEKLNMTKSELEASVSSIYSKWILYHEQIKLVKALDSIYQDFLSAAESRFASGDINSLEMVMAETKAASIMNTYQRIHTELVISENDLRVLLNTDSGLKPQENEMIKLDIAFNTDSISAEDNPYVNYVRQYMEMQEAEMKSERSYHLPDFSIGYFNQTIDKTKGFDGIQLGMTFPIWFWGQSARVKAKKIEIDKARNQLDAEIRRTETEIENQFSQLEKYTSILSYYEEKALKQANIILKHSTRSYTEGEISYVEYVSAISDAFDINIDYLEAIDNYNQTVIRIHYLIGNYQVY